MSCDNDCLCKKEADALYERHGKLRLELRRILGVPENEYDISGNEFAWLFEKVRATVTALNVHRAWAVARELEESVKGESIETRLRRLEGLLGAK